MALPAWLGAGGFGGGVGSTCGSGGSGGSGIGDTAESLRASNLTGVSSPKVGVVMVNYAVPPEVLAAAVRALVSSVGKGQPHEIVIVDNASPRLREEAHEAVVLAAAEFGCDSDVLRWINSPANTGFAGGVNQGIAALGAECELVFLCNPDARVEPNALDICIDALVGSPPLCVAVAPKMILDREGVAGPLVLDSVGNAVNEIGEAFNVGLGQPDLGQYDVPELVFGPCFGAALFRRTAFSLSQVGPLDERLFLYYEDVDWNWRAQLLGFDVVTCPSARVHHTMSITMRDHPYDDKFRLTERNLLLCALKNMENSRALLVVGRRSLGILRGSLISRHYPVAGLRALAGVLRMLPSTWTLRSALQRARVRSDREVFAFSVGERTFFNAVTYQPERTDEAHAFAESRLARILSPDG